MADIANISYIIKKETEKNNRFFAIFNEKIHRKEDRGTPENGDMQVFSIRILFSTLIDASLKWAQNRTN